MTTIALLGTGLLGAGMVENLLAKGHTVRIWNRSRDKLAPLVAKGAIAAADAADCARGAARVHLVLAEDPAVDAVIAQLRPGLGKGVPVIDHSTNSPAKVAARCAALRAQGVRYVHAPVFMSPQNAREASGMIVFSGPRAEVAGLEAELAPMTGKVWYAGERDDLAAIHKLAGNSVFFAMVSTVADVFAIGAGAGVPAAQMAALFEVFKPFAPFAFLGQRVVNATANAPASFELQMARKDARLMVETAGKQPLLVLPGVCTAMDKALTKGLEKADYAIFAKG